MIFCSTACLKPSSLAASALVLIAFLYGLSFQGYQDISYAPAALALLALAGFSIGAACLKSAFPWPSSSAAGILFVFWAYVTLTLSWSSVPFSSLVTYLVFITLPLTFFGMLTLGDAGKRIAGAASLLVGITAALAGFAIWQHFFIMGEFGTRAHLPLADPNNLAALFNLALFPVLANLFAPQERKIRTAVYIFLSLLLFCGLLATESRGGLIVFVLCLAMMFSIMHGSVLRNWKTLTLFVALAAAAFIAFAWPDNVRFTEKLAGLSDINTDSASQARLAIWAAALQMFKDNPLLGTGLGTFYLYYPAYRLPGADDSTGHWAHMDPLQLGIEMGVAAPLLFYALVAAVAWRSVSALRASRNDVSSQAFLAGLCAALLGIFLHCHITFQFYVLPILLMAGLWLALWQTETARLIQTSATLFVPLPGWQKYLVTIAAAGCFTVLMLMTASSAAGTYYLLSARDSLRDGRHQDFMTKINLAERYGPASFADPGVHLASFYISLLENPIGIFSAEEKKNLSAQTLAQLDYAAGLNPAWAEIDFKRGKLYLAAGDAAAPDYIEQAIKSYESAVAKNKLHISARVELSSLYMKHGRAQDAYDVLQGSVGYPLSPDVSIQVRQIMAALEPLIKVKQGYESLKTPSESTTP